MTLARDASRNTFRSALGELSNAFNLVLLLLASRWLGTDGYGRFLFAMALSNMAGEVMEFGIRTMVTRDVARTPGKALPLLRSTSLIQAVLSVVAFLLIALWLGVFEYDRQTVLATIWMTLSVSCRSFKSALRGVFRAYDRFDLEAITLNVERIGLLVFAGATLILTRNVASFALAFFAVRVFDLGLAYLLAHRMLKRRPEPVVPVEFRTVLRLCLPFAAIGGLWYAYFQFDNVLLSTLRPIAEVGLYGAAFKLVEVCWVLPRLVPDSIFPLSSRHYDTDRGKVAGLLGQALRFAILTALPICGFVSAFGGRIMALVFSESFRVAGPVIQVLIWSLFFFSVRGLLLQLMQAANRERLVVILYAGALALNVALNLVLIPRYTVVGVAWSRVVTEVLFCVASVLTVRALGVPVPFWSQFWKPAVASAGAVALCVTIQNAPLLLLGVVMAASYFGLLYALRAVTVGDLRRVRNLLRATV
jgi:O-antigen/teichoic acid export membrane protein